MRTTLDFSPLFRTGIGFDRLFQVLDTASRVQPIDNWPPYDIVKEGEDRYRIVMEHTPTPTVVLDLENNGRFLEANESAVRFYGVSRERLLFG